MIGAERVSESVQNLKMPLPPPPDTEEHTQQTTSKAPRLQTTSLKVGF